MRGLFPRTLLAMLLATATAPPSFATAEDAAAAADVKAAPACVHCGMDRAKFAHSRMLLTYEDGSTVGLCSVHCAAVELAVALDKHPRSVQVADQSTKRLVDAEKAVWVMGGKLPGVMTRRAKWAFADRTAAERFAAEQGGELATFDEVMKATYEDMHEDTKMIRERRKKMRAQQEAKR